MKTIFKILMVLMTLQISAQEDIEKNLGDFDELKVFDLIHVNLIKSNDNKVIISGDNKNDVSIVNDNGILKIKMELNESFDGKNTKVSLYFKELEVIDVNEGATITSEDTFKQYKIELRAQEGGKINIQIDVTDAEIKSVTGGEIETSGNALRQDVSINTGGIYRGKNMISESTYVSVRAAGDAYVNASKLVDAKIRVGGNIYIFGNPQKVNESTVIGGNIKRLK